MSKRERRDWPRCEALKRDGSKCGSSTRVGEDGEPAADGFCQPHAPRIEPQQVVPAETEGQTPEGAEAPRERIPVDSLRDALRDAVSTEEVADLMQRVLLDALAASKESFVTCAHCGKRHPVHLPDLGVRAQAVRSLIESLEGRLKEQTDAEEKQLNRKAELVKRETHEMTDDELALRIALLEEELGHERS